MTLQNPSNLVDNEVDAAKALGWTVAACPFCPYSPNIEDAAEHLNTHLKK